MKNQLLFTLIGLHLGGMVMAQDSTTSPRRPYRVVLKLAPLSRLDPDATFQGAVEYQTGSKASGQLEFGYGGPVLQTGGSGPLPWTGNNSVQGKEVWRIRAERRFYRHRVPLPVYPFYGQSPITQLIGSYFSIEALYKQTNVARLDTMLGGETSPRSFVEAPVSRRAYALYGKFGIQEPLSGKSTSVFSRILMVFGMNRLTPSMIQRVACLVALRLKNDLGITPVSGPEKQAGDQVCRQDSKLAFLCNELRPIST